MKKLSIIILLSILLTLTTCQCRETVYPDVIGYGDWEISYTLANKHIYYLDADAPDDSGDGLTPATAWKTLAKVQSMMSSGDTIYVMAGSYGGLIETEDPKRTDWVTFVALESNVIFGKVTLDYRYMSNCYLRFDGIIFEIETDADPATFEEGINLRDLRYFELRNCEIYNTRSKYMMAYGIIALDSTKVLIYNCHFHTMITAIALSNASNITIHHNHIHELAGGVGVIYNESDNCIIELNNIYDSNQDSTHPDYMYEQHSASVHIKGSNIIIRKNLCHGIGTTAGMNIQTTNTHSLLPPRSNILIENNLIYDSRSESTFIIENLGEQVIIRNNTFVGKVRATSNPAAYLWNGFVFRSFSPGYNGEGLYVYNNIVIGNVILPKEATIYNNIFWSFFYYDERFQYRSSIPNNIIVTSSITGTIPDYFINGFFNGISSFNDFAENHNLYKDFTLAPGSPAINAGCPKYYSTDSLGSVNGVGGVGFLLDNGKKRNSSSNSIGCYEY